MHLTESEALVHTAKRHLTPYILKCIEAVIVLVPVYIVVYFIVREFNTDIFIGTFSIITFLVIVGFIIGSLDYILDSLIVTNKRIIWIDWKSLLKKREHELHLKDIQNVSTSELGILSKIPLFKFGTLEVESAASQTSVIFKHCADPITVKHLILAGVSQMKNGLLDSGEEAV